MFVLGHLSDPHLEPVPSPRLSELANKRVFGYVNWQLRRRSHHRRAVVDTLTADLKAHSPDHVAVTGDLINIGLDREFSLARSWLESLGDAHDISLVPGNHDAYVRATAQHAGLNWRDYLGDAGEDLQTPASLFPFVRRRDPVVLIGVSTAVPSGILSATGEVGPAQLARLAGLLAKLKMENLFRVLVIHHPPVSTTGHHHKRLIDAADVLRILKEEGVDLVIHGHEHVQSLVWIDGPDGRIPVFGVSSASATATDKHPAGYNLYWIDGKAGAWRCEAITRGLNPSGSGMIELKRRIVVGEDVLAG